MSEQLSVVLVCVNYVSKGETQGFIESIKPVRDVDLRIVVADNSPTPELDIYDLRSKSSVDIEMFEFSHNPGYLGGARLALAALVAKEGKVRADAVVLLNTDVTFETTDLVDAISRRLKNGDRDWLIAPRIQESGRAFEANPHVVDRPARSSRLMRFALRDGPLAALYHRAHIVKRRLTKNDRASNLTAEQVIYAGHGSFIVFGSGYFLKGGSFPESPLYDEEFLIAEMAFTLDIPVVYDPQFPVVHVGGVTTDKLSVSGRVKRMRESGRFYRAWNPANARGSMTGWFCVSDLEEGKTVSNASGLSQGGQ